MAKKGTGAWMDKMLDSVNSYVTLETTDGIERGGRISGFTMRKFVLNNQDVEMPTALELNGDPNDKIPLERIAIITIG